MSNTMAASAAPDVPLSTIQDQIADKLVILAVRRRCPSFSAALKADGNAADVQIETTIGGTRVEDDEIDQRAILLSRKTHRMITRAFAVVKNFVDAETKPFAVEPLRVLPAARRDAFFSELPAVLGAFREQRAAFLNQYAEERPGMLQRWKDLCGNDKHLARRLPPADDLEGRIDARVMVVGMNFEDANDAAEAIKELTGSLRGKLASAMETISGRLSSGDRLSDRTFTELRNAIRLIQGFSDVCDSSLNRKVGKLSTELESTIAALGSAPGGVSMTSIVKQNASTLKAAIDQAMDACKDPKGLRESLAKFGAAPRRLSL